MPVSRFKQFEALIVRYKALNDAYKLLDSSYKDCRVNEKDLLNNDTELKKANELIKEALKVEQAAPKTVYESNSKNWYFYAIGGSAFTVITYFIFKTFVFKR